MHPALLTLIVLFALVGHGYLWIAVVNRLHGWSGPHRLIDVLTLLGLLSFLILPLIIGWQWWLAGPDFLHQQYTSGTAAVAQSYLLGMTLLGFGKLIAKFVGGWKLDDPSAVTARERRWVEPPPSARLYRGPYAILMSNVPGNQALQLTIEHKHLALPRLPEKLVGFRIAHVSDWHLTGRIDAAWFEHVTATINSLQPDVIMITGDLMENEACRPWLANSFGQLQAKHGVYFILGNHDYYINATQTIADLERMGLRYVGGERYDEVWNDVPVSIGGNELPWNSRLSSFEPNFNTLRIALIHTPDQFDWACENHIDLALAGHTHGGQVCFPILGAVAAPSLYGTRLAGGTFRRGQTVMHVTRGISGETPLRWLCPPEIALLELAHA
jgi:predicted MPP superfamily phosphohydrolase